MADDDHLVATTKARLVSLQKQGLTLQRMLYNFVVSNISLFFNQGSPSTCLSQLPTIVRQQILSELTKFVQKPVSRGFYDFQTKDQSEVDVMIEAVKVLLNRNTTSSFDFTWLMAYSPAKSRVQSVEHVLEMTASLAPNIKTLSLQAETSWGCACQSPLKLVFTPSMLASVGTMNSLQTLQLQKYKVKYQELLELGTQLPHLQNLSIRIRFHGHFEVDMLAVRKSLPKLKQFFFSVYVKTGNEEQGRESYEYTKGFAVLCIRHLPGLEAVGSLISPYKSFGLRAKELAGLKSPCRLRQLRVRNSSHAAKAADWSSLFPDVTDLEIRGFPSLPMVEEATRCSPFLQFTKLVGLHLWKPTIKMYRCLTERYGPNLHTLTLQGLSGMAEPLTFREIFTLCPNLSDLFLFQVDVVDDAEPFDPQLLQFSPLKKLYLFFPSFDQKVVISHILSAPRLQMVELAYLTLDAKQVQLLSQMVLSQQIFGQLESFKLQFALRNQQTIDIFKDYCQLVKNVCAYSPQLVQVSFHVLALTNLPGEPELNYPDSPSYKQAEIFEKLGEPKMGDLLVAFKAR